MRRFTPKEDNFIRDHYLTIPAKRISKMLGRSENAARQRMKILGLVLPPDVLLQFKELGRYKPGTIPANKGKKWKDYMPKESQKAALKTTFKKGNLPHNTLEKDGIVSTRVDKLGTPYQFIRVKVGKWVAYHRYLWMQKHGKIKRGMNLVFKDGDTMNCNLENLELITNAELMRRNTYHNYPKPIANTIQLRGALTRKINKRLKQLKDEKQDQ